MHRSWPYVALALVALAATPAGAILATNSTNITEPGHKRRGDNAEPLDLNKAFQPRLEMTGGTLGNPNPVPAGGSAKLGKAMHLAHVTLENETDGFIYVEADGQIAGVIGPHGALRVARAAGMVPVRCAGLAPNDDLEWGPRKLDLKEDKPIVWRLARPRAATP